MRLVLGMYTTSGKIRSKKVILRSKCSKLARFLFCLRKNWYRNAFLLALRVLFVLFFEVFFFE